MFVNDRTHTDTHPCRLSGWLYRGEAGAALGRAADNLAHKGVLSVREKVGFRNSSNISDTQNSKEVN